MSEKHPPLPPVEFIDRVSSDNIPESLRPILDELMSGLREQLGDHLISVYLHGSSVRGDFVAGESDLDVFAFSRGLDVDQYTETVNRLAEMFSSTYDIKVDLALRAIEDLEAGKLPNNSTVLAACGALCYGEILDFRRYVPSREKLTDMLTDFYKAVIDAYSVLTPEELATKDPRRLLKFALRTYGLSAVRIGAPFSTSLERQSEIASEYLPEHVQTVQRLLERIRRQADTTSSSEAFQELQKAYTVYLSIANT